MARRARTPCGCFALLYFVPPNGLVPEMDFSSFQYLLKDTANPNTFIVLCSETVSNLVLNPSTPNHKELNNLLMRRGDGDGVIRPAHLPNYHEIFPLPPQFHLFLRWCLDNSFNPNNISPGLQVVDPIPMINFNAPVIELDNFGIRLCMGTYTDAFQVMKLPPNPRVLHLMISFVKETHFVPSYNNLGINPYQGSSAATLVNPPFFAMPHDTLICCWNVKGLARPSLVRHFHHLYNTHNPAIVVLLEACQSIYNVQAIVNALPGNYSVFFSPPDGLTGGLVALWRNDIIAIDHRVSLTEYVIADVYFKGQPATRRTFF